ncbi:MAG: hypothetical protein ACNYVW_00990 [Methanosarcinales archaeon]
MKMKLGAGKKKAKARGPTAKPSVKKAISALNGIEKAEKIQEKIVVKKKAITERARSKNDETLIKRAESEEQAAIAVLERIRADKNRAETELKSITAGTAPKKAESAIADSSSRAGITEPKVESDSPPVSIISTEEQEQEDEGEYREKYPVIEPYAYVTITKDIPPLYKILEVQLTKGEEELLSELKTRLYATIDVSYSGVEDVEKLLKEKVDAIVADLSLGQTLTSDSLDKIFYYLKRDFLVFGKLDPLLNDTMSEDISADGPGIPVFIYHRTYHSIETNVIFEKEELDSLIYKMAQRSETHITG